jgi:NAD(P)-dependent dehydrogenase (short-subunit alcohol dehydrogenase family)
MTDVEFRFGGKVALVTGGASLLGSTIVRAFHAAGASVVIADLDEARGKAVADPLGDGVLFIAPTSPTTRSSRRSSRRPASASAASTSSSTARSPSSITASPRRARNGCARSASTSPAARSSRAWSPRS